MSAWEEAATDAVRAVLWQKREFVTAPDIMEALAPHIATRDAATWAQACKAQRLLMHHLNRHIQRLDEFPLATPELMQANGLSAGNSPEDAPRPLQPQSGGTE